MSASVDSEGELDGMPERTKRGWLSIITSARSSS